MPIARCEFCTDRPHEEVAVSRWTTQPEDRDRVTISVCAKHLRRVRNSGERGYEHSGYRYKIGFW